MNRHAKAASAQSVQRQAPRPVRLALLGLTVSLLLLFTAPGAGAVTYSTGTALSTGKTTTSVAVNQSTRDLYVSSSGTATQGPFSVDGAGSLTRFDAAGAELSCSLSPSPEHPAGLAIDPASGRVHVVNQFSVASAVELRAYPAGCGSELAASTGTATTTEGSTTLSDVVTCAGTGTLASGSQNITGVATPGCSFIVGQTLSGTGVPAGATVTAVGSGTLEISAPAEASGAQALSAGPQPLAVGQAIEGPGIASAIGEGVRTLSSKVITGVTASSGSFAAGQKITGVGIPGNATIVAIGAGTIEISASAQSSGPTGLTARTTIAAVGPQSLTLSNPATATASSVPISGMAFRAEASVSAPIPQLAADSAGRIYLPNRAASKLQKLEPSGLEVPLANPITGLNRPGAVALDAAGNIYIASGITSCSNNTAGKLTKYKPNGELIGAFAGLDGSEAAKGEVTSVAVDRGTGNVYVGRGCQAIAGKEFRIEEYGPGGTKLAEFGKGLFAASALGATIMNQLAVDETSNTVYAADPGNLKVQVFTNTSPQRTLSTTTSGAGAGAVQCNGTGAACLAEYDEGQEVTVEAVAAVGSQFTEWSGGTGSAASCNGSTSTTCTFLLGANSSVNAVFAPSGFQLTVNEPGSGTGTVKCKFNGGPEGSCGGFHPGGTGVEVIATPAAGSELSSISGANSASGCTGSPCAFTLNEDSTVTATFNLIPRSLSISENGTGTGTVKCKVDGGPEEPCPATVPNGKSVEVIATPNAGSQPAVLSGTGSAAACGPASPCNFGIEADSTVTATFNLIPRSLSISENGTGTGAVKCKVDGGPEEPCPATVPNGKSVEVIATPNAGSQPAVLSGTGSAAACGPASPCNFAIEADSTVTATFNLLGEKTLTIGTGAGTGTGSVNCEVNGGPTVHTPCASTYPEGTTLELIPVPGANSQFAGYSVGTGSISCSGTAACTFTLNADSSVQATFDLEKRTLAVTKNGTGTGTVTSVPAGINCGATCSAEFDHGQSVTLSGASGPNTKPVVWSGCDSVNGSNECVVSMSAAKAVTATFDLEKRTLAVTKNGTGTGTVTSVPAGINCGATCSAEFDHGQSVTLSGASGPNTKPVVWSGCDSVNGSNECVVSMSAAKAVTATFDLALHMLTINKAGTGDGSFECKTTGAFGPCASTYEDGTTIMVKATPDSHSTFVSWAGCSSTSANECTVTAIGADKAVTATLNIAQRTLNVAKAATGTGDGSFECKTTGAFGPCASTYEDGTTIMVKATPDSHSTFVSWAGCSSTSASECTVSAINAATTVTATFDLAQRALDLQKAGTGGGSLTCDGGPCAPAYADGTTLTLRATADPGSSFGGWSGGGCAGTGTCQLTIEADTTVTASFNAIPVVKDDEGGDGGNSGPAPSNAIKTGAAKPKGASIALTVTVPGPGKLVTTGKGIKATTVSADDAGVLTLRLKLSAAAKRKLARKGKLKVKVKLVFTPLGGTPGATTKTVIFRANKGAGR